MARGGTAFVAELAAGVAAEIGAAAAVGCAVTTGVGGAAAGVDVHASSKNTAIEPSIQRRFISDLCISRPFTPPLP